jgi:hypothetical protein
VSVQDTSSDALLSRLISSVSSMVRAHTSRTCYALQSVVEVRDGTGTESLLLREWPVVAVSQVSIGRRIVPQSPGPDQSGWVLSPYLGFPPGEPQVVRLRGCQSFCLGSQNVSVAYQAGYVVSREPTTVVEVGGVVPVFQVQAPLGPWIADGGVVRADTGAALQLVSGTPGLGQYSLPTPAFGEQPGQYQFSLADVGAQLLVSYSYVPSDLEQVVVEMVGERFAYRGRIGQRSKSLGGQETVSFSGSAMPEWAHIALRPYVSVVPVPP